MKKILSIVLLLAMCLSLFAGCTDKDALAALENAKDYLEASYKDDAQVTGTDYQRGSVLKIKIDGVDHEFQVAWSTNSDKVKVVAGEGKMVTIAMPYDNLEDVSYTLTATISDANGNSVQVSFDRTVPARPGIYTDVENGTYVIVADGNKSYTSLTEDKSYGYNVYHEVTVENGTVSGHYKADVLTITNVEGVKGFTIQDAYGRYVYMKGTYNSCNVSAEMPEEGHIWQLLADKDGKTFIINAMNMKILAFDTGYSSWGAYPEITEARKSEIQLIKATAPETDPEQPEEPKPDVPNPPATGFGVVDAPEADKAYKFGMVQGNVGKTYYLAGGMDGYYMATTEDVNAAIDVYLEATEGGYYFYTMVDGVKTYINMVISGEHVNGAYEATASTVYTYDSESKTITAIVNDAPYWFGTRNDKTYTTMGPCKTSYNGFYGQFYGEVAVEPEQPSTGVVEVPEAGEAYKFGMVQGNLDNAIYYLAGGMDGYYMATTTDVNAAIDVYLEATEGGYYFYTLVDGTKTYINMVISGEHVNGAYEATASTVYTYDAESKTITAIVNDAPYWFGTRNDKTYTTMGPCKTSYNGFYGQFYGQVAAEPEQPEQPETPENPGTSDVTLENGMKVVIYAPGYGKALSSTMSGYYQTGVDVTLTDGVLTGYTDAEVWTVVVNADGTYSFEMNGQKLAMGAEYASMKLGEVNDAWEIISLSNGLYNIKNVVRGNYIDWYAAKSNWSTYNQGTPAEDPAFQLSFFVVE